MELPAPQQAAFVPRSGSAPVSPVADFRERCRLETLGDVWLDPVSDREERRVWEATVGAHHPLGWSRAPGAQMRYWVRSSRHPVLGAIGFSAASWHQKARDDRIGWSPDARAANLGRVVCNHRFLLLPGVRVHGLASRVLRLAEERLSGDWETAYRVAPVLAYTYVGPGRSGVSYAAAGWMRCEGKTSGRPPGRTEAGERRAVWMRPLAPDWRPQLCTPPPRRLQMPKPLHLPEKADEAEREYARGSHPDGRVRDRIVRMGRAWLSRLGTNVPAQFPRDADRKAAYRLLSNEAVKMEHVLSSHHAATVERCAAERVVLAVQDTTALNYGGLAKTEGLVPLGDGGSGSDGLVAHFGLAARSTAAGLDARHQDFPGRPRPARRLPSYQVPSPTVVERLRRKSCDESRLQ